ncbi:MAG: ATP-binding protein [Verrucomicrobia bacterium]|nr:ATP-binding protein [Verrucomicrobiota bacterium]
MANPTADLGTALRPRARLLRTLGEELISNEVVAIIELVKNAYDADATHVLIRFTGPLEPGKGCIDVIDNGHGMELETVQTVWMEPATPSKRGKLRRTDKFKRRFLGEKGIGRFASSRLANELEVISRKRDAAREVYGIFDWRQFDDEKKYFDEILILWEERKPVEIKPDGAIDLLWKNENKMPPPHDRENGTVLRMTGLKQKWEAQHFDDLRRALARLVSPKFAKKKEEDKDPGFEVELALSPEFSQFSSKVEPPPILKHPHYIVSGSVNADGSFSISYKVLAEGIEKPIKGQFVRVKDAKGRFELRDIKETETSKKEKPQDTRSTECGPLDLELRVWDRDELGNVVQKTHSTIKDIRRDLDAVAGINIYRDGFRVLPYGEPQDDWLRLDLRRVQNPTLRLSNNQIYGVVHISADANPKLQDQSNREGLDENQALEDLRDVMTDVLSGLETLRYSARPRTTSKSGKPIGGIFSGFDLKPLTDYLAKQMPQDKAAKELVEKTEAAFGSHLKEIQTVLARYQRLATLGQLIDHVLHEGRQPIASINNEAELGLSDTARAEQVGHELAVRLTGRFTTIRKQGDILATAFRRMEPFGGRKRGRPSQLYLEEIIRDAFGVFTAEIERLNVKTALPRTQTLVRVDPSEMQEVIINLLQNSLYWLEQVNETKREIAVKVERKAPEHVDILFSDSGPGVPPENREMIFEPYFSTKPVGIGLGLSIVGEIVTDYYGGSLQLLDHGPLKGANLLVTLKKRV